MSGYKHKLRFLQCLLSFFYFWSFFSFVFEYIDLKVPHEKEAQNKRRFYPANGQITQTFLTSCVQFLIN